MLEELLKKHGYEHQAKAGLGEGVKEFKHPQGHRVAIRGEDWSHHHSALGKAVNGKGVSELTKHLTSAHEAAPKAVEAAAAEKQKEAEHKAKLAERRKGKPKATKSNNQKILEGTAFFRNAITGIDQHSEQFAESIANESVTYSHGYRKDS